MNVLLSAYSSYSKRGSESLVGYHYARILSKKHRVVLITCAPSDVTHAAHVEAIDLGERNLNEVGRWDHFTFELAQWPRARRLIRQFGCEVIHRATPVSVQDPTLLSRFGHRFVLGPILSSGTPPESFRPYLWREIHERKRREGWYRRLRPLDRLASFTMGSLLRSGQHFRKAEVILVGTGRTVDEVPREFRHKCVVVPHIAVETDLYLPSPAENDCPIVLYAGRLTGHKGLELMIRALATIKDKVRFRARIIGGGTPFYESFLRRVTSELQMDDRIEFVPPMPREELRSEIQRCDVLCFPSLSDTYGVVLLEAMSCERACVVADTGGPADIVQDGCGLKVPLENPGQFIAHYGEAVMSLLKEPALRDDLGRRARELILRRNRWEMVEKTLAEVYDSLERRA